MRKTALMYGSADSGYKQKSPATSSAEEVSATLALDHVIVKAESKLMMSHYHEASVETKDTEREHVRFPLSTLRTKGGGYNPMPRRRRSNDFTLFTGANSGHSPGIVLTLHFALGPLRFHILLAK
jgi:hypothetical protein